MKILWLDDMRDPMDYFKPTPARLKSGAFQRNTEFYNNNVFKNGQPDFVWVKNFDEFTNYIIQNGLPDMVSFDHDLGKGLKKGADCAKWLLQYCRETGQQMPRCFAHSANPNGRREIGGLLGLDENNNRKNKNIMKITESQLRKIIKDCINEMVYEVSKPELDREWDKEYIKNTYNQAKNFSQNFNPEHGDEYEDDPYQVDYDYYNDNNLGDDEPITGYMPIYDGDDDHVIAARDNGDYAPVDDDDLRIDGKRFDDIPNDEMSKHAKNLRDTMKRYTTDFMYDQYGNKNIHESKKKVTRINESKLKQIIQETIKQYYAKTL